jgi:hypothetical protein
MVQYEDREGMVRSIEVQLRTKVMHSWAVTVEMIGGQMQEDLKSGRGPQPVLEFFEAVSEAMAFEERGEDVPQNLEDRFTALRILALPLMSTRRHDDGTH